jgi:polysaccharide biosynthesis/export protein
MLTEIAFPSSSAVRRASRIQAWPVALGLAALLLSGCAAAPGMYMTAGLGSQDDAPPPGALLSITPDLIRQQRALQKAELGADVQRLFGQAKPYAIGPADVINIVVWGHPELVLAPAGSTLTTDASGLSSVGNGFNVSPEGLIQFPLIGNFNIAGLTENQARDEFTRRLAKFINKPQVTLRVQAYRAGRVYVDGEVRLPGLQAINDIPMTLPEGISRAGGLTPLSDRASVVVTRNGATTVVNLAQLAELGVNPSRIMLAAGDLVRVGNRDDAKVYVMGEVTRPTAQPLRNGRLTLNEALGESGGVSPASGDPRQIYVVRSRNGAVAEAATAAAAAASPANAAAPAAPNPPEIYHLDARSPAAYALAEGFELKARDVVFVDPTPLVRWNRVISLILPSAAVASTTRSATGN